MVTTELYRLFKYDHIINYGRKEQRKKGVCLQKRVCITEWEKYQVNVNLSAGLISINELSVLIINK